MGVRGRGARPAVSTALQRSVEVTTAQKLSVGMRLVKVGKELTASTAAIAVMLRGRLWAPPPPIPPPGFGYHPPDDNGAMEPPLPSTPSLQRAARCCGAASTHLQQKSLHPC